MKKLIYLAVLIIFSTCSVANTQSPYAGQEHRKIKALSQQKISGYLTGKGLGYAKAAELNHYPGPKHVLDLAKELELTNEQVQKSAEAYKLMQEQAVYYGEKLVTKERELDLEFANSTINENILESLLSDIAILESKIRYVHLHAHLVQKTLLNEHQITKYDQLRAYSSGDKQEIKHHH